MKNQKITIEISNKTASEYGYGKYVNAVIENSIWAWECLPFDATDADVKAAAKRVRARARYAYEKALS